MHVGQPGICAGDSRVIHTSPQATHSVLREPVIAGSSKVGGGAEETSGTLNL